MNVYHYVSSCALGVKYSVEIENLFFFCFLYLHKTRICRYVSDMYIRLFS